jgi:hypothetical protein
MTELAQKVLDLCVEYFGPAARKFLDRQAGAHMNGMPFDALDRERLPELIKWIGISGKLYIDKEKTEELVKKVSEL